MEDSHRLVGGLPDLPDHSFFTVMDGHGGSYAALFCSERLLDCVRSQPEWAQYASAPPDSRPLGQLKAALERGFIQMDEELKATAEVSEKSDRSGCTCVSVLVTPTHVVCANAGDSRAVMSGPSGEVIALSDDHKPYNDEEKRRIERAGGCVSMKRVDGDLAVSRAFGDFQRCAWDGNLESRWEWPVMGTLLMARAREPPDSCLPLITLGTAQYKDASGLPPEEQKVTSLPDVTIQQRRPGDEFVLLACDGIWDVMTNQEGVSFIREMLTGTGEQDPGLVCEELIDSCLGKGSRDNMTSLIVYMAGTQPLVAQGTGGVAAIRELRAQREAENQAEEAKNGGE